MQLNLFMFLLHFPFLSSFECFSQDFKLTDNRNRLSLCTGGINPSASANCLEHYLQPQVLLSKLNAR